MNLNQQDLSSLSLPIGLTLAAISSAFEIIAQPCYTSRLRYRSDFTNNKNRRGVLHSQNNPNYHYPAIRIPSNYLSVIHIFCIRVCLVTIQNEATNCRFIHPYDLEDVETECYNDRRDKAVWYPISGEDITGIKCFPNLRIVKKTADDLKNYGALHVFDSSTEQSAPQLSSSKDTIREFNLDRAQLAFTIGEQMDDNGNITKIVYSHTTIFSEELIETTGRETDTDSASTTSTAVRSQGSESSSCLMYKYAPRSGHTDSHDEVLIFFNNRLKCKKYGNLQVTFECTALHGLWSQSILDLEVKDQMVSFRTPCFPFRIDQPTPVMITLKQNKRTLEPLVFNYLPTVQCSSCRGKTSVNSTSVKQTSANKRPFSDLYSDDAVTDSLTITCHNNPDFQQSNEELEATPSVSTTTYSASLTTDDEYVFQRVMDILGDSIARLFSNHDYKPLLRICRPFIQKRPELLHNAISNNHSDLLAKFIPISKISLLQYKNQSGDTALLHAARLNRLDIVRVLVERKDFDQLLDDRNDRNENVFHILASTDNSEEILDLLMEYLYRESIDIGEELNDVDDDNHTPLQLAIMNNNLDAKRHFLNCSDDNLLVCSERISDDLIRLAVLYDT